jgi:hypothetical protein
MDKSGGEGRKGWGEGREEYNDLLCVLRNKVWMGLKANKLNKRVINKQEWKRGKYSVCQIRGRSRNEPHNLYGAGVVEQNVFF